MPIEGAHEVDLDAVPSAEALASSIADLERGGVTAVTLTASPPHWDVVREALPRLRAAGIAAVLLVKKPSEPLFDEEITALFDYLKLWDQFLLHNVLEACPEKFPKGAVSALSHEAKLELKWITEWAAASADPRVHKYPGLPWRRFIRKINDENYAFVIRFLEHMKGPETQENVEAAKQLFRAFLEEKKKVVNLFPKKWKGEA